MESRLAGRDPLERLNGPKRALGVHDFEVG